jgi:hypothetical protein
MYVNKAYLATQDRTITSIGKQTLPAGRVIRFEDLVLDLISQKHSLDTNCVQTWKQDFFEDFDACRKEKFNR